MTVENHERPPPAIVFAESARQPERPANDRFKGTRALDFMPTAIGIAEHLAEIAGLHPGQRLLEPSAGTGRLINAAGASPWGFDGELIAVEVNPHLAMALLTVYGDRKGVVKVKHGDFFDCRIEELGPFDRILLAPPTGEFAEHLAHAITFLRPGGRLAGIAAAGIVSGSPAAASVESIGGVVRPLPAVLADRSESACMVIVDKR